MAPRGGVDRGAIRPRSGTTNGARAAERRSAGRGALRAEPNKTLRSLVLALRGALEGNDFAAPHASHGTGQAGRRAAAPSDLVQSLGALGIGVDRALTPDSSPPCGNREQRERRRAVEALLHGRYAIGESHAQAVAELVRMASYQWANRLLALRCLEARGLIDETIVQRPEYGGRSLAHHRLVRRAPGRCEGPDEGLLQLFEDAFALLGRLLPAAFPPGEAVLAIRPTPVALARCVALLSGRVALSSGELADDAVFCEPDALGWAYQHWHASGRDELARAMRIDRALKIDGPRLRIATQHYSERYMVRFLVRQALGGLRGAGPFVTAKRGPPIACAQLAPGQRTRGRPASEVRVFDPACGSGHFLLEAFDWLFDEYVDEHPEWAPERVARTILETNLFGLDIDPRAVQIAAACLWMRAAERGRLDEAVRLNLVAPASTLPSPEQCAAWAADCGGAPEWQSACREIARASTGATELGALLRVEPSARSALATLAQPDAGRWLLEHERDAVGAALGCAVRVLAMLDARYDLVVANPPYVDKRDVGPTMRTHLHTHYRGAAGNTYAAFIVRGLELTRSALAMVTPQTFLFVHSYEPLRRLIAERASFDVLCQLGTGAFGTAAVDAAMFVLRPDDDAERRSAARCVFADLREVEDKDAAIDALLGGAWPVVARSLGQLAGIKGSPFLFGAPEALLAALRTGATVEQRADVVLGVKTSDNRRFVRYWWELGAADDEPPATVGAPRPIGPIVWCPYEKQANGHRYGANTLHRVRWCAAAQHHYAHGRTAQLPNERYWFRAGLVFGLVSHDFTVKRLPEGHLSDMAASCIFPHRDEDIDLLLGLLNSRFARAGLAQLNPTVNFQPFDVQRLPLPELSSAQEREIAAAARVAAQAMTELRQRRPFDPAYDGQLPLGAGLAHAIDEELAATVALARRCLQAVERIEQRVAEACGDPAAPVVASAASALVDEVAVAAGLAPALLDVAPLVRASCEATGGHARERAADLVTATVLRLLGGTWPLAAAVGEPLRASDGIASFVGGAEPPLHEQVCEWLVHALGASDARDVAGELARMLGLPLAAWLATKLFARHAKQFHRRPLLWQLASRTGRGGAPPAFSCLVHAWQVTADTFPRVRTRLVRPWLARLEQQAGQTSSSARRQQLEADVAEVVQFDRALESVERGGFHSERGAESREREPIDRWCARGAAGPPPATAEEFRRNEARYLPNRHDGIRVNLAPLEQAGLLAHPVLGGADAQRAIDERAVWRAGERQWCRDGLLVAPSWWTSSS